MKDGENKKVSKVSSPTVQAHLTDLKRWGSGWRGVFERLIKSVKRCLKKTIRQAILTLDELTTDQNAGQFVGPVQKEKILFCQWVTINFGDISPERPPYPPTPTREEIFRDMHGGRKRPQFLMSPQNIKQKRGWRIIMSTSVTPTIIVGQDRMKRVHTNQKRGWRNYFYQAL